MAAPLKLLAWPVRFASSAYVLRVTANSVTEDLDFPASGTLDTDRFYWTVGDEQADADGGVGGVGDLLEMLETTLETHSEVTTATVTLESWRTKIGLDGGGGAISASYLWSHANTTLDPEVFGFEASDVSSVGTAAVDSPNLPQGLWRPKIAVYRDVPDEPVIVGGTSWTVSGDARSAVISQGVYERAMSWRYLNKAVARTTYAAADEPTGAWEEAWTRAIGLGYPFRVYDDEGSITSTSYKLYKLRNQDWQLERMDDRNLLWWQLAVPARLIQDPAA